MSISTPLTSPDVFVLSADDVAMSYAGRTVFDGVSVGLHPGHRLGMVGENGAGKSTLLRILAGLEEPDAGKLVLPQAEGIGYLSQELPGAQASDSRTTVSDVVEQALEPSRRLLAEMEKAAAALAVVADDGTAAGLRGDAGEPESPDTDHYAALLALAEITEAWDAPRRAELTVEGLGLASVPRDRPLSTLSGGQRARLALAALLIRRPQALLLDEPTNHLDDAAIEFLEATLREARGIVVVASHDRVFLDNVCTSILDLDPALGGYVLHRGAYSDFLKDKKIERAAWQTQFDTEQEQLAALRESVRTTSRNVSHARAPKDKNKMSYGNRGDRVEMQISRRVRNAKQRLEELERDQVRKPPKPLRFAGLAAGASVPSGSTLLTAREIAVTGRLAPTTLSVTPGDRLLVTGSNGSGKSTLLAVLAGRLAPSSGTVDRIPRIEISLLEQEVRFPDGAVTSRGIFQALQSLRPDTELPDAVALGLLPAASRDKAVRELSEGQRRRVALAMLVARPPHVLLLDEPTNHLSLTLAEELQDALGSAPGAVIVASHDRWLRRRWQGPELELEAVEG